MPLLLTLSGRRGTLTLAEDGTWSSPSPALLVILDAVVDTLPGSWRWQDDPMAAYAALVATAFDATVTATERPPLEPLPPGAIA